MRVSALFVLLVFFPLSGCTNQAPSPTEPTSDNTTPPPSLERNETWFFHHTGGCKGAGKGSIDRNDTMGDDNGCASSKAEVLTGSEPLASYPANESTSAIPIGSVIGGEFIYRLAGPGKASFRLVLSADGTELGQQTRSFDYAGVGGQVRQALEFKTTAKSVDGSLLQVDVFISGVAVTRVEHELPASFFTIARPGS